MITLRRGSERGSTRLVWLDSRHTFSFNRYVDPRYSGYGTLRVINDDRVAPGGGFGLHGHRDMEILSIVLEGALVHEDSLGTRGTIAVGDVQRMSAGTGIRHAERNASAVQAVRFLQIWIEPARAGLPPSYEQRAFPPGDRAGRWQAIAAPEGRHGALTLHQDAELWMASLGRADRVVFDLRPGRRAWIHLASGRIDLAGTAMDEGDGAAVSDEKSVEIVGSEAAEVLLFDLA